MLWAFLAIGIGAGSMLAGRLSGDKVELGLVPLGSLLMGVFTLAHGGRTPLLRAGPRWRWCCSALASGLFIVPLNAYPAAAQREHARRAA